MHNLFFSQSKFNYVLLFCLISFIVPIFFSIEINDFNLSFIKGFGYISQQLGYEIEEIVAIAIPINFIIIAVVPFLLIISKQNPLKILTFDIMLIIFLTILATIYIYIVYETIPIRVFKSSFAILYFLFTYNLTSYLIRSISRKELENIFKFFVFFSNLIIIIYIFNIYFTNSKYNFLFDYTNYQYSTYFPYFIYLLIFINLSFIIIHKNIFYILSFVPIYIFISIVGGVSVINSIFLGILNNYFIGVCLIGSICLIIFKQANSYLNIVKNINLFFFINLFILNIIIVSFLSFGFLYGKIPQIDERVRQFYFALNDLNLLSFFGIFGNSGKIGQSGTAHNDFLELFSIFGIFIYFIYSKIYSSLSVICKNDFLIYSGILVVIFIGGLSTTVLMSLYLNFYLAIMLAVYEKKI